MEAFTPALGNDGGNDCVSNANKRAGVSQAPSIGKIIGTYKSLVSKGCLELFEQSIEKGDIPNNELMGKLWQRNYYEHIIRDEQAYQMISNYIINNPQNWSNNRFFEND
jgi:REP element-mobilizing transposase RayT